MKITSILIANRGEIAARVARTCKRLGIRAIGIHSDADADSLHVRTMDEAVALGGSTVSESYLDVGKILAAARVSGAQAVHPGYGLLSENADFARRCTEAGLIFIGPTSEVIERMGSKIEARQAMEAAGVPFVPGIARALRDEADAIEVARAIGYPVMLKASAGGGGIGIQVVRDEQGMEKAFAGNSRRAKDFFGDGAMYIEKYIEKPRHIEIQILADHAGNTVHLGERECSIQRRHQKVIEEAPSPFLDQETRDRMGEAAVRAARAIGYRNAGTMEFLVDQERNFYFLEMNTRLQVEHPVTEEVVGLDLVEQQIRIAEGAELSLTQDDVNLRGHAIEARIYAEDPKTFFPSPGTVKTLVLPQGEGLRHEMAVREGAVVSHHYDPMIAKLVVKGRDRAEAIDRLRRALEGYVVEGIKTNIPLLKQVVGNASYLRGETSTDFLARELS